MLIPLPLLSLGWAPPRSCPPVALSVLSEHQVVLRLPGGSLMGCFVRGPAGSQEVAARHSSNGGLSWSPAEPVLELPPEPGSWSGLQALLDRAGEIHLFLLNDAEGARRRAARERGSSPASW